MNQEEADSINGILQNWGYLETFDLNKGCNETPEALDNLLTSFFVMEEDCTKKMLLADFITQDVFRYMMVRLVLATFLIISLKFWAKRLACAMREPTQ